ncbi:hypothetical protein [Rubrobacter calidifluminis]|uniref:hypothetical protein n=1 Tax=Rubrobacter calidifluminis TaxID=1392640 RepID=UPI00235F9421|nr:hypothetical protein [Rubrobacter calidifluminis]
MALQRREFGPKGLRPAEVEVVLRRAAELNAARGRAMLEVSPEVPLDVVVRVAATAGIREEDVRRALGELGTGPVAEAPSLARRLYGPGAVRVVREVERPVEEVLEIVEGALAAEGLHASYRSDTGSVWEPGEEAAEGSAAGGAGSRGRTFCGAGRVEVRAERLPDGWSRLSVIATLQGQRGHLLSLGGIVGATLAVLPVMGGFQDAVYFLGVIPAFALPMLGFRAAYHKNRREVRRTLLRLLDGRLASHRGDRGDIIRLWPEG